VRALVNPGYDPARVPSPAPDAPRFHAGLPGYAPTPVRDLRPGLWVKDESNRLGLPAFKILGASWAARSLLGEPPYDPEIELVAATDGNHGRAVARVARERGLEATVFVPQDMIAARREAIAAEGAEVVVVDGTYEDAVARAAAEGREPGVFELADVGSSPSAAWVIDGYATLFAELEGRWDVIVVPVGVGSLAAAAARHGASAGATVIGAEPVVAACLTASLAAGEPVVVQTPGTAMAGLDCAEVSPAAWPSLRAGIRGTVTVTDDEARAAMRELAAAGLEIGESGAAPLAAWQALHHDLESAGLRAMLRPGARVLLLATEGRTA
jgi:diaminopropionate ammonia-lyase